MADIVETVPYNFDELYEGLKTKFEEKGYDTEEGSNTSQLITAMTYLTSMLNVNTATNINETILPLATKVDNAMQDARALGYEVKHKRSYQYNIKIKLDAGNHKILKYSKFTYADKSYYYLGKELQLNNVPQDYEIEIPVIEGTLHKFTDNQEDLVITTGTITDATGIEVPQYYIDIPYVDVENDNGIEVYVTYYNDYGSLVVQEEWKRSKKFMIDADTQLKKEFIRLDNIEFKTPRIYFTLAGIGEGIREGSNVEMNILTTKGPDGAIDDITDTAGLNNPIANSTISGITLVSVGQDEETIDQIKANASLFHNTANRAVTKLDYEAICNRENSVKTSLVWGGDDEYPRCPGHIWFSFVPTRDTSYRVFTNDEFKTEFTLDNAGDYDWDFTIEEPYVDSYPLGADDPDYKADLATYLDTIDPYTSAADEYSAEWFLQNNEIRSTQLNEDGDLIKPGVWDILDEYKIPTLEFHNRHPLFLDFEYDINILKYNIADSKAAIHQNIFDAIDGFFTGINDDISVENFETEYFHSSLEKRVDTVLTDITGFNNTVSYSLKLSKENISSENPVDLYKDLYIPLAVPFEDYFDNDGYLLYDVLPNIDTPNFVEYTGETGKDLYVDWSGIQADIDNTISQVNVPLIQAPVRVKDSETVILAAGNPFGTLSNINLIPDDPTDVDGVQTYDQTTVYYNGNVVPHVDSGEAFAWFVSNTSEIAFQGVTPLEGDVVQVDVNTYCGTYFLFNSYKKHILIQLFVDGAIVPTLAGEEIAGNQPKSYLTTVEGFYDFTVDSYYLTTEGYHVGASESTTSVSGVVERQISPDLYDKSPLKLKMFLKPRTLNLKYQSANFMTTKNVIPRLKRVTFTAGV